MRTTPRHDPTIDPPGFEAPESPAAEHDADRGSDAPLFDHATASDGRTRPLGELLVVSNILSADQVERILEHQKARGLRFGDTAVALGYARRDDVLRALARQFDYQYVTEPAKHHLPELFVANEPFSERVEAFRDLRSHVLTTVMAEGERRRALAVLSANVGDGKTFIAANLAVAFSQLPGRTLVVDTDMRSPRLHAVFGIDPATPGLSNLLSSRGGVTFQRPLEGLPSLHVLPVGALPPNPSELVQQKTFHSLMASFMRHFDHVIVDTPAATHGSDARLIASRAGAALVIGRRHRTRLAAARKLVGQLGRMDVAMAGMVVNDY